ncbi:MAG: alpha-glucosidase, partial [Phycisphaerae bacterium]
LSFEKPRPAHTPSKGPFAVTPRFSKEADKPTIRIAIDPDTSLYGTGSVSGPLLRNGRTVTLWNTDAYGYDDTNASLYQSHPWVLAVRPDGTAFGILIDSTFRMHIAKPSL